ncbi:hypothetical protein DL765_005192 [Monosporascus sp. GIB2]|nr:hypothetical protein DL765_005192 [Monosporascus sp. GIB2]
MVVSGHVDGKKASIDIKTLRGPNTRDASDPHRPLRRFPGRDLVVSAAIFAALALEPRVGGGGLIAWCLLCFDAYPFPRQPAAEGTLGAGAHVRARLVFWQQAPGDAPSTHHHFVNNVTKDFIYVPWTWAQCCELLLEGRGRRIDVDFDLDNNYHHHYHQAALVEDGSAVVLLCTALQ